MGAELLNADFNELLPVINVSTSNTPGVFSDVGGACKDVIITNLGPNGCIVTSNIAAAVPGASPVQKSAYIAAGAIVTMRKGLNVKTLNFICPTGSAVVWAQASNGA